MEGMFLQGVGASKQRTAIVNGLMGEISHHSAENGRSLSTSDAMALVLLAQYMEC